MGKPVLKPRIGCSVCGARVKMSQTWVDEAQNGDVLRLCHDCWIRRKAWIRLPPRSAK